MRLSDMKRDANSQMKLTETCSKRLVWGKRAQKYVRSPFSNATWPSARPHLVSRKLPPSTSVVVSGVLLQSSLLRLSHALNATATTPWPRPCPNLPNVATQGSKDPYLLSHNRLRQPRGSIASRECTAKWPHSDFRCTAARGLWFHVSNVLVIMNLQTNNYKWYAWAAWPLEALYSSARHEWHIRRVCQVNHARGARRLTTRAAIAMCVVLSSVLGL